MFVFPSSSFKNQKKDFVILDQVSGLLNSGVCHQLSAIDVLALLTVCMAYRRCC